MTETLPLSERLHLVAELEARTACPRPHSDLPVTPAAGSNVAYVSRAENARLVAQAMALGFGRFRPAP
jgi:hypothetical protein